VSALIPFNCFFEDVAEGKHALATHQLRVALSNTAPDAAADAVLADITEISYANCSSRDVTVDSSSQSGGIYTLVLEDLTLTATGGTVGPFRYVVLYNATTSGGPLIAYMDIGSSRTIQPAA
jgi:hypothetical protein